jgi:predicted nucleotidyltransferase
LLKNLFSSEVRILLLNQFLLNENSEFYLRQLSKQFNLSPRQVSLELQNLQKIGLIKKRVSGNLHNFSVNKKHPIFHELKSIFLKTVGLKDVLLKYFADYKNRIDLAFVYGSMAKGDATAESDIDLMIIGKIGARQLSGVMSKAGNELKREINYSVFSLDEFKTRLIQNDHFISTIIKEKKLFILGDVDDFERLVQ